MTVAFQLLERGKRIPPEWRHDPTLRDNRGNTIAMGLFGEDPNWYHDPSL